MSNESRAKVALNATGHTPEAPEATALVDTKGEPPPADLSRATFAVGTNDPQPERPEAMTLTNTSEDAPPADLSRATFAVGTNDPKPERPEAMTLTNTREESPPADLSRAVSSLGTKATAPEQQEATGRSKTTVKAPPAENSGADFTSDTDTEKPQRRTANHQPVTQRQPPSVDTHSSSEANACSSTTVAAPRRRKASAIVDTMKQPPSAETNSSSGASVESNTNPVAPQGRRKANALADTSLETPSADHLVQTCLQLAEHQRVRRYCIVTQQRLDRAMESFLAHRLGFSPDAEEAERKARYKEAGAIMRAVEAGKPPPRLSSAGDPRHDSLTAAIALIPISAQSRRTWDAMREQQEAEMRALAATLPVWPWVRDNAKGVGALGLARLIGEAPLIYLYVTHEKLWKRLGLAVVDGERQQKKTNVDEALIHGYRPMRRAEAWSVCSDTMLRAQWRGAGDEPGAQGYAIGPYGEVYRKRKAHTQARIAATEALSYKDRDKWTPKRADADARRVMTKEFLRDLWRVWHGKEARHPSRFDPTQEAAA